MPTSFLRKYNEDYNPVNERLELKKKLIIRISLLIVSTIAFFILRLLNSHRVFTDLKEPLLITIYLIMGLSSLVSLISIGLIIFSLAAPKKAKELYDKIPYRVKKGVYNTLDWTIYIPICICVALYFYAYTFRIQPVAGSSMENSFSQGNRVISIYDTNIKRGDVVVAVVDNVKEPKDNDEDGKYLIKRVIGVPGDKISYTQQGLYINDKLIQEEYVNGALWQVNEYDKPFFIIKEDGTKEYHTVIPKGYYFIMGDNRNNSNDSRDYGLFSEEEIISVVVIRVDGLKAELVERGVLE